MKTVTCYNCGVEGHISPECTKPKKNQSSGKVYALSGSQTTPEDRLIKVTTSFACLNYPVDIFGRKFGMELVCLPLEQLDVIRGMNWMEFNRVHINCFTKTVIFPEESSVEDLAMTTKQLNEMVKEKAVSNELPVVQDFPEVFPEEVRELPPEREVEFVVELIPGTSPVSMAPYRMSESELTELKSQLE
ncbi:uncharacterized protein LOC131618823 [Vicia villosa]|uniref:uncharacterized protein LOC131618823 n=1 Tax=Vicia villosa TaxID=3911 RepID=UPI00273C7670|nr:uncharacterized protein LOC131618823 [Vicia villosa]